LAIGLVILLPQMRQLMSSQSNSAISGKDHSDPLEMPKGTKVWVYLYNTKGNPQVAKESVYGLIRDKDWSLVESFIDGDLTPQGQDDQPNFKRMIHLSADGPKSAEMIIIWDLSHFSGDPIRARLYCAKLSFSGWKILSLNDNLPLEGIDRIYEKLIQWDNEYRSIVLRVGTKSGLQFIAEKGCLPVGSVAKGYLAHRMEIGSNRDGTIRYGRKPFLDPDLAPSIKRAFEMKSQGIPVSMISESTALYPPGAGSWDHFFRNRAYIGEYFFQGRDYKEIYPPIVSEDLFSAVQSRLKKRKIRVTRDVYGHLFDHLAVCAYCGSPICSVMLGGCRFYLCERRVSDPGLCPASVPAPARRFEKDFISLLNDRVLKEEHLTHLLDWSKREIGLKVKAWLQEFDGIKTERLKLEISSLRRGRKFDFLDDSADADIEIIRELEIRLKEIDIKFYELEQELKDFGIRADDNRIQEFIAQAKGVIRKKDPVQIRTLIEQLFSRIALGNEECLVEVRFPVLRQLDR
jgi:hypothetical protein